MYSFRRIALSLALVTLAVPALQAQSSSSNPPTQAQPAATTQQLSVQARIRARREQRRSNAIHEAYSHRYEAYTGVGYLRFTPGPDRQRTTLYAWDTGLTRYYNDRLGVTVDGRGYYGTAFVGLNTYGITRPAISQYDELVGPTYRFYLQPKYSISGRVMAGYAYGNFSGDTGGNTALAQKLGLYPDGSTYAASASMAVEYNVTPNLGLRLAPEYFLTGFNSTQQNGLGFTSGLVYRFGKK
jgi:hypothetical protein